MDNNANQFTAIDMISLISLVVGYENLIENREQSAANDVQSANDIQAKYLLDQLASKFDEQNKMLHQILDKLGGGK